MTTGKAPSKAASVGKILRKTHLTLFLRGRTSAGLNIKAMRTSVGKKLGLVLIVYSVLGLMSLVLLRSQVFLLSVYLHGFTFLFIGTFLVSGTGEALFDKDEPDVLLHRPIQPKTLLWAKISVLVLVSLYLSLAFNLAGLFVGLTMTDGNYLFPIVHIISCAEESLFGAASVVLVYQLCLRLLGRQRLDNVLTTSQVLMMVVFTLGTQIVPHLVMSGSFQSHKPLNLPWWLDLLPPAWFAGLDDALAGSRASASWGLAGISLVATASVSWLAFWKLAKGYETDLQTASEPASPTEGQARQVRFLTWLAGTKCMGWLLQESVSCVSFVLTAAYLWRDRETKLRIYPTISPVLIMPVAMAVAIRPPAVHGVEIPDSTMRQISEMSHGIALCFGGAFLGSMPFNAIGLLSYTQQWKAFEVFLFSPIRGPWPLQRGAIVAVNVLLVLPLGILLLAYAFFEGGFSLAPIVVVGLFLVPVYSRLAILWRGSIPLSLASEEAIAASRGCLVVLAPLFAMIIGGIALLFRSLGWLPEFLIVEAALVFAFCTLTDRKLTQTGWRPSD
jgi:ABC-2 type transport system permease protein